jgi:hypothetical protein
MKRIKYYTQAADGEVSGLGTVIKDEKGRHVVNKVFLLEQESSGADTELDTEAISKLMTDMMAKNEDPALLKFWWHSHANMGVFWSGTDDSCAETLSKEFAFSLVVNKAGDLRCRLDLYNPFRITFDGIKVTEIIQEDASLKEQCEKEIKEKVKSPGGRWQNWKNDNSGIDDYYGGFYGQRRSIIPTIESKSRVRLPEHVIEDIERLCDLATENATHGGIFCVETWNEFILKTLKEVFEKRFEKKAGCNNPGTFDKDAPICVKKCKMAKACAFWTKFFDETEADAKPELEELNKDTVIVNES